MGLVTARDGIASAIDSIGGLSVFDHVPDQVGETPAVVMRLSGANYTDQTFTFALLLITTGFDMSETEPGCIPTLILLVAVRSKSHSILMRVAQLFRRPE